MDTEKQTCLEVDLFGEAALRNAKQVVRLSDIVPLNNPEKHLRKSEGFAQQRPGWTTCFWKGTATLLGTIVVIVALGFVGVRPGKRSPPNVTAVQEHYQYEAPCTGGSSIERVNPNDPPKRILIQRWCSSPSFREYRSDTVYGAVSYVPSYETDSEITVSFDEDDSIFYDRRRGVVFTNYSDRPQFVTVFWRQ